MGFLEREIDRIRAALLLTPPGLQYDRLYAAQQALAWAGDPDGFKGPYDLIMKGTPEDSKDCSVRSHPPAFLDSRGQGE